MRLKAVLLSLALGSCSLALQAGDLSPEITAKLIKIIAGASGGKVACRDATMKAALEGAGVTVDGDSKIVWATNPVEVKSLRGRLVIVGKKEFLSSGAAVAIAEDGGKPKIFLNQAAITASGLTLSDAILKIAEKL
ncbi:MAG: DUF4154 domain-containing protein [Holophaga sp.]|nr:DUF4154 domain-containing protein [Holophaga sp.]